MLGDEVERREENELGREKEEVATEDKVMSDNEEAAEREREEEEVVAENRVMSEDEEVKREEEEVATEDRAADEGIRESDGSLKRAGKRSAESVEEERESSRGVEMVGDVRDFLVFCFLFESFSTVWELGDRVLRLVEVV